MDTEYVIGKLSANVTTLTGSVDQLNRRLDRFGNELDEIKLFRAKVMGASLVISIIASGLVSLLVLLVKAHG